MNKIYALSPAVTKLSSANNASLLLTNNHNRMKKISLSSFLQFPGIPLHFIVSLIVLVGFMLMTVSGLAQTTKIYSSTGAFTPPAGITTVIAECWGGGGKGGSRTTVNGAAAGGGGGAYSRGTVNVVAGMAYTVTVGTGSTTVAAGLDSWFGNTPTVLAKGGSSGGDNVNISGAGGASAAGIGDYKYSGGLGNLGDDSGWGGGGGSSGGTEADGIYIIPSLDYYEFGGSIDGGGSGGDGSFYDDGNGTDGGVPGGGGGGAYRDGSGSLSPTGGNGGNGQVRLTYNDCVTYSLTSVTSSVACAGGTSTVTLANTTATNLPVGTYTVTYSLSGGNIASNQTAVMTVTTAGIGNFTTIALANGASTTITINSLASGSDGVADLCTSPLTGGNTGTITVNSSPAPTFTTAPGAVTALNTDVTYTTQASQSSYVWTYTGTLGIDYSITSGGGNTNSVTLKWLTAGNKTVTVNYSNGTCPAATPATNTTAIDNGDRYSVATGNWNATSTWAFTLGGAPGASIPGPANNVFIVGGNNVTVTTRPTCASLTFTETATSLTISLGGVLRVSGAITIPRTSGTGVNLIAVGAGILNAGSIAFTNGDGAVRHEITISSGTVAVFGDITTDNTGPSASITFTGAGKLNAGGEILTTGGTLTTFAGCTVNYNRSGNQVVKNVSYFGNLILSGSGLKTWTRTGNAAIGGNFIVDIGTVLTTTGNFTLAINGATTVSGTLNLGGTSAKTFTGDVIVNNGGVWNETEVAAINYGGNLQNNGTYTGATGIHTFTGAAKTIGGVNAITIPNLSITGTTTNNGTLIVSTTLAGTGTLTNSATGTLNFGGNAITPTLAATAPGNTVSYTGAAQTVKATTYDKLALSGGNIKTMAATTIIINDNFSIASGTKADLGTITTHTAKKLTLDGAGTLNGKWGSSGATGADYKNDNYFVSASAGYITVSTSSCTAPEISSGPTSIEICENGGGSFTVVAPGSGLTYQWQYANASPWINTDGIPGFTGHTSATLTLSNTPLAYNGVEFRCVVTSGGCSTNSGIAALTVNPLPAAAGSISGPFDVLQGTTGVAYSVAPVTNAASYAWAYSGTGVTINGTGNNVTLDFSFTATSGDLTVKGQNSCGDGASSVIPITVGTLWVPTAFNVTGNGGVYCSGGTGSAVGLSGSENGVTYTLFKDAVEQPSPVAGTGAAISFGPQLAGTYTVKGSNGITTDMTGSAVITAVAPPTAYAGPTSTFVTGVPFLLSGSTAANYTSLAWSLGTNATGVFNDATILHPTYTQSGAAGTTVTLILTASNGGICPDAVSQVQLVIISAGDSKTWAGGSSNSWEASGNWTPTDGFIPKSTTNVTIPSGTTYAPIINSAVVCNDLTIASGAVLTIATDKSLSVGGTFSNNAGTGGLIIKSGGSLIANSVVNATVERAISAWTTYGGWHLLSSPVTSQVIDPTFTDATPENYDFYAWSEPLNTWMNQKVVGNGISSFVPGTGYLVAYANGSTKQFTGTLNTANLPVSGLTKSAGENSGWHLLGNPFPSAIVWGTANWSLSSITATAKVWAESSASYKDIAPSAVIPAMNGFMVETFGGGSLTIPTGARVHNTTPWYKSSESEEVIKLVAHDIDYSTAQESIIKVDASATEGFDSNFDSHFLAGFAPSFYSTAGAEKLSTNALPEISSNRIIPMGFTKNTAGNFSIELVENNISGVSSLFLTDKKTGTVTDLNETPVYNFTASDGDDADRFELSFLDVTGVTKPDSKETFTVYQSKGNINITSQSNVNTEILVTNLVGQVVMRGKTNGNALTTLNAGNLQNGVYVVSLVGNGKKVSKKLVVSR